jgi:hypothetical protein
MAGAIIPISKAATVAYNDRDLALIRRTVAADTNNDEFNLFIRPAASAFTQLCSVRPEIPRLFATEETPSPPRTSRTASCLNSSVYCPRNESFMLTSKARSYPISLGRRSLRARSLGDARPAHRPDEIADGARRDAVHIGLPDDDGQRGEILGSSGLPPGSSGLFCSVHVIERGILSCVWFHNRNRSLFRRLRI